MKYSQAPLCQISSCLVPDGSDKHTPLMTHKSLHALCLTVHQPSEKGRGGYIKLEITKTRHSSGKKTNSRTS